MKVTPIGSPSTMCPVAMPNSGVKNADTQLTE